ncbi:MAG: glycosyl transferase family 1 [Frankiales bacterium]|nr:glycosyl transferase family 1 [Frankiales bacterium]
MLLLNWRDLTNPEGGGSELYVESLASRLARRGDRVTLFCADHGSAPRDEVKNGVRYVRRGNHVTVYLWAALLMVLGRLGRTGVVVEVHNGVPFLARLFTRRRVVVLVHHVHREQWGVVFGPKVARIGWWLESWVAPRVNRRCSYVAVSEVTKTELVGLGIDARRISVVHNGTSPAFPVLSTRATVPTIAVLGRLVPHKRVELVLDAAAELRHEIPDLRVEVAGDGYWHDALVTRVAELGLQDIVTIHGRVSEPDKHELLARSWVHAVPSLKEGWGLSVVEAGGHATPSVAFRYAGGLAESVVDGVTGVLADDEDEFREALRALLTDPTERVCLGRAARVHAGRFTWAATAAGFSDVLDGTRG